LALSLLYTSSLMSRADQRKRAWGYGVAAIATLVVVAIGLCLFHSVSDDGMSTDLCTAMLASIAGVLLASLVMKDSLLPDPMLVVRPVPLHLLDPPPRSHRS